MKKELKAALLTIIVFLGIAFTYIAIHYNFFDCVVYIVLGSAFIWGLYHCILCSLD